MSTSATAVRFDGSSMWVDLADGRILGVPLAWFPRLLHATAEQRASVEICRHGLHWEVLDEDISISGLLESEGQVSQADATRWNMSRPKPKDPSLIPQGRYCYRWVNLTPGETAPSAGSEFGRLQREGEGYHPTVKQVLCPYLEASGYGTVRCLFLGLEVLRWGNEPEDVAPRMLARFGTAEAAHWFEEDNLLGDRVKVCGVGVVCNGETGHTPAMKLSSMGRSLSVKPGDWVEHSHFGVGLVLEATWDKAGLRARVDFGRLSQKWLALDIARLRRVAPLSASQEAAWRRPKVVRSSDWRADENPRSSEAVRLVGEPRRVREAMPPYKALRGLMADVLAPTAWLDVPLWDSIWMAAEPVWPYDTDGEEACGCWPGEEDADGRALDVLKLPAGLTRWGTVLLLHKLMDRFHNRLSALQAKAVANGRWWPDPLEAQVLLSSDGLLGMRVLFPPGFSPAGETWFTFWHPTARTVRQHPRAD